MTNHENGALESLQLKRRWQLYPRVPYDLIQRYSHLPPLIIQLLHNRGLTRAEDIEDFLSCACRDDNPFQLAGMNDAVARIRRALRRGERIAIYGDFDADGVTATVLLTQALQALGADVRPYIPHRVDEGYGLNCEALQSLAEEGIRLVITVDCGIRSADEIAFGKRAGLDIIVTDHHHLGSALPPALACVNPRREDSAYRHRDLAGVGVAFKLAQALLRAERQVPLNGAPLLEEEDLLDLVAVGTVADLVPLFGENRSLVARGLEKLRRPQRIGLQALIGEAGINPDRITSTTIGWTLAPRLNAAGRLDSAMLSFRLLHSNAPEEAARIAHELGAINRQRQELTERALQMALSSLMEEGGQPPELLFFAHDELQPGIVGLVAGRLTETFYRPAVVVERGERHSHGSARSIPEFHITRALDECSERGLLVRHGGHAAAAGFTVETARLEELRYALTEIARRQLEDMELTPALLIDAEVDLQALDWATLEMLHMLEPFGYGNYPPLFLSRDVEVLSARTVGTANRHLKLSLSDGRRVWDAIAFSMGGINHSLARHIDVVYYLEENEWNGQVRLQLNVQDIRPAADT